jgi:hypothetical protein
VSKKGKLRDKKLQYRIKRESAVYPVGYCVQLQEKQREVEGDAESCHSAKVLKEPFS